MNTTVKPGMSLEQMDKKIRTVKSMLMVFALALDDRDVDFDGPAFALALREVESQLAEVQKAMDAAFNAQHIDLLG
jgi:hypothetical protein